MSDGVIRIDLYGKGAIKCRPYIQKTFAYETIFVLVLQNCPIRTKYYFYTECYWAVFSSTSTNFVLKSVVTLRPVFGQCCFLALLHL